jgi:hypothetical protein
MTAKTIKIRKLRLVIRRMNIEIEIGALLRVEIKLDLNRLSSSYPHSLAFAFQMQFWNISCSPIGNVSITASAAEYGSAVHSQVQ